MLRPVVGATALLVLGAAAATSATLRQAPSRPAPGAAAASAGLGAPAPGEGGGRVGATGGAARAAAGRPTLLVFVTIDQMRADYFARFGPQLTGGLRRLYDEGAYFSNAHQDHAITETAPGHASAMSGRFPASTGILRNAAGVQDPQAPLVGAAGPAASPFRFRGTVLFDWLRLADPRARALSVSAKDRGAILPLGRAKQSVFWWSQADGRFTTSTYYADTLPDWVKQLNARDFPRRYAGRSWEPLLPPAQYPEPDTVAAENGGRRAVFPYRLPEEPRDAARAIYGTPWMDEVTAEAALAGLEALQLGRGPQTDVLAVSFSATDAVGHAFGMDSRELHDQVLRLDRTLGAFLDSLYRVRDPATVIVALTGDHGMAPYPELHFAADPKRGRADVWPVLDAHRRRLAARGVDTSRAFELESGALLVDEEAFRQGGVKLDSAMRAMVADLRRVPGVHSVLLRGDLAEAARRGDKYAGRWQRMLPADLPVAAVITLQPYVYYAGVSYATHGSPHDYDSNVPVLFHGAPFRPGRHDEYARVVDMAPTLAAVLGVRPTEPLDGRVLVRALRTPETAAAAGAPLPIRK